MAKRQLLWLAPRADAFNPGRKFLQRWEPHHLPLDRDPANESIPSLLIPRVGLLDLSNPVTSQALFLQEWLERLHPTYWVGLLREAPTPGSPSAFYVSNYCADFHTLPCDQDRLVSCLGHLWGMATLKIQVADDGRAKSDLRILKGRSEAIESARSMLHRFAQTHEPVMIIGASGTGKESAARYVHRNSSVSSGPFIAINCSALPESLIQSELFGHEKGAFTGAVSQRIGRIEAAEGGTLLLDGVDELLPQQQTVLLRFLQEGRVERVGSHKSRRIDVRVISTCSRRPDTLLQEGLLRADLYYRLAVLQVALPLLRERMDDLPLLIDQILTSLASTHMTNAKRLSERAMACIYEHHWPGNIRELQNRLRRAALMSESSQIEPEDMGLMAPKVRRPALSSLTLEHSRNQAEQRAVTHSLALSHQNISAAARLLNISRLSLYRLMEKYGLERRPNGTSVRR